MNRMRLGGVIVLLIGGVGCGQDRQVAPLSEAPVDDNQVPLYSRPLVTHADFDQVERDILERGSGGDLVRLYDDLARLAPGNVRVLVRGALAALAVDPSGRGPAIADGVIQALGDRAGSDPDVAWLVLRRARLALAPADRPLAEVATSRADATEDLVRRAEDFARAFPDWKGPHGATVQDALRMAREARGGVPEGSGSGSDPRTTSPGTGGNR